MKIINTIKHLYCLILYHKNKSSSLNINGSCYKFFYQLIKNKLTNYHLHITPLDLNLNPTPLDTKRITVQLVFYNYYLAMTK